MAQLFKCRPSVWFADTMTPLERWLVDFHTFEHLALELERKDRKDRGARRAHELAERARRGQ